MVEVCITRPNRSKPRVFTERDVGRILAHAREDGAQDILLIANILEAFGIRAMSCLIFKILDILNTAIFLGAILGLISGLITIVKGIKLLLTGKRQLITSFLQVFIPKKWLASFAKLLLILGSLEAIFSALAIFITSLSNNIALFLLMKGICQIEVVPFNKLVDELDIGDLEAQSEIFTNALEIGGISAADTGIFK